jgi:RNA polymerase sigma-70 factor (ECF subfamily)
MLNSVADLEIHRAALTGHCYRMLGSPMDADDAVQDTMIRAWRALDRFDGRSSLRTWLYRIATNVCLDALAGKSPRTRPVDEAPSGAPGDDLVQRERTHWLEPIPDNLAIPEQAQPNEVAMLRQSIRLAFVAALQRLPPRQRAALLLVDVLGWSAAETAEGLDMTVAAVNSALQRARATMAGAPRAEPGSLSAEQQSLVARYVEAFEKYDIDLLVSLLHEDASISMPPYALWLEGVDNIRAWLLGRGIGCNGSRLLPVEANCAPAFAQYRPDPAGGHKPWALIVLELEGPSIAHMVSFLDTERLFPLFGLPPALPPEEISKEIAGDR